MQVIEKVYDKNTLFNKAIEALKSRGLYESHCGRCGKNQWAGDIFAVIISTFPVTTLVVPPPHMPVLVLTCTYCGNTVFHNLKALGVI